MDEKISGLGEKIEEMNSSVKVNIKSKERWKEKRNKERKEGKQSKVNKNKHKTIRKSGIV